MNVLTVGCFDMLHEGHANLLRAMGNKGRVVVILHDDKSIWLNKGRFPVQPYAQREINLYVSGLVSEVVQTKTADPSQTIMYIASRGEWVFMRGDDWSDFPGRKVVESMGIPIELVPYTKGVSSSERVCRP